MDRKPRMTLPRLAALFSLSAALWAQAPKPVLGTVTGFKKLEIAVKSDAGETVSVGIGPETEVVQASPGERDLTKATRAAVTDILNGDRVMMSFVPGMKEARRIVLITSRDIAARNEAEKADWQARGINGLAVGVSAEGVRVLIRTPEGNHETIVTASAKTNIRRYAPDSVKFTQAPGRPRRNRGRRPGAGSRHQERGRFETRCRRHRIRHVPYAHGSHLGHPPRAGRNRHSGRDHQAAPHSPYRGRFGAEEDAGHA